MYNYPRPLGPKGIVVPRAVCPSVRPARRPYEPCDRNTAHSVWAFILHMMIVPWEKRNPIDFGWPWPIFKVTEVISDLVFILKIPCDRDTGHSFWAKSFILYMMIAPWKKRKPIDFGWLWPIFKVTEIILDIVFILKIPRDRDTGCSFWPTVFILYMMIAPWEKRKPIDFWWPSPILKVIEDLVFHKPGAAEGAVVLRTPCWDSLSAENLGPYTFYSLYICRKNVQLC